MNIYIVLWGLFVSLFVMGQQAAWQWVNPYPTGSRINQIFFLNEADGFIIGDGGTLLQSEDGGNTWVQANVPKEIIFMKIFFSGATHGWVVGHSNFSGAKVFSTINGGITWAEQTLPFVFGLVQDIYFYDAQTGWIAGENGMIFRTTDGGNTWIDRTVGGEDFPSFNYIRFTSATEGVILGRSYFDGPGFVVGYTENGGDTWNLQKSGLYNLMYGADFLDNATITAVGDGGLIIQSNNNGANWSFPMGLPRQTLVSVDFYNNFTGITVGESGNIVRTDDGGVSWDEILSGFSIPLRSVQFVTDKVIYASGSGHTPFGQFGVGILTSTDGGTVWSNKAKFIDQAFSIQGISFTNATHGWIAGDYYIYGTTDGGANWSSLRFNTSDYLQDVVFTDSLTGFAAGNRFGQGMILRTTNGGGVWQTQTFNNRPSLLRISFPSSDVGYASGEQGVILKTVNKGQSWSQLTIATTNSLTDLEFISNNEGWVCAGSELWKTTDGGATWNSRSLPDYLNVVSFPGGNTGYAAGNYIFKSTDSGATWEQLPHFLGYINDMVFTDANNGWVAMYDGIWGTADGGANWQLQFSSAFGSVNLTRFALLRGAGLWAAGSNTSILKWTGGPVTSIETGRKYSLPEKFTLDQNYPNPFNPATTIRYGLPYSSQVKIDIFNALGQKVTTLVDEQKPAGFHIANFDAQNLASGMYFYRITAKSAQSGEAKEFNDSKKMILMK